MTHCPEFWDKLEKEPDFCSISPSARSEFNAYFELRDKVVKMGVDKRTFYLNCPSGACRPLFRTADDKTRTDAVNYIINCLSRGETITQSDLKAHINNLLGNGKECKAKPGTQMRKAPVKEPLTVRSLGDQIRADEMQAADANQPATPEYVADVVRKEILRQEQETMKIQSPFKTGLQVKDGIAGEMYPKDPAPALSQADQERERRAETERIAQELLARMPQSTKDAVRDIMREHTSYKVKDVFFFGVEALHDKELKGKRK